MDSNIRRKDLDLQDDVGLRDRLLGITSEVGGGIATDWASSGLLAGGPAGWAAYGLINFGQGAYTNYLVQKHLYGEDNIKWGEVWASGGMGMIPFSQIGASAKAAKYVGAAGSVKRGLVGGAAMGLAGEQLRVGIDEGEFLSPLEATLAAGIGGGLGGGLQALFPQGDQLGKGIKKWKHQRLHRKFGPGGTHSQFQRRFIKPDGTYDFEKAAQVRSKVSEGALGMQGLAKKLKRGIDNDYKGFDTSEFIQGSLFGSPRALPEDATVRLSDSLDLLDNSRKRIYKQLDETNIGEAAEIISNIESYIVKGESGNLPGWSSERPTFAFPGKKTLKYVKKDGTQSEMGFRWSASQKTRDGRKGAIIPYDVPAAEATAKARYEWDQASSVLKRKERRKLKGKVTQGNLDYDVYMKWLKQNDPELYFRIIEDSRAVKIKRPWYVEHHVAREAKIWERGPDGIFYHKFRGYAAGDPDNMTPIFDSILGKSKTEMEDFIYSKKYHKEWGKHFGSETSLADAHYVDFDLDDFIVRSTYDNAEIYRISALTNKDDISLEISYAITRPDWWVKETEADRLARLKPTKRPELGITDKSLKGDARLDPSKSVEEFKEEVPEAIQEINDQLDYLAKADTYYGEDIEKMKNPYVDLRDPNLRRDAEARYDLFKDKVREGEIVTPLIPGLDEFYISRIMVKMFEDAQEKYGR